MYLDYFKNQVKTIHIIFEGLKHGVMVIRKNILDKGAKHF